jgi:hypothetical protein
MYLEAGDIDVDIRDILWPCLHLAPRRPSHSAPPVACTNIWVLAGWLTGWLTGWLAGWLTASGSRGEFAPPILLLLLHALEFRFYGMRP